MLYKNIKCSFSISDDLITYFYIFYQLIFFMIYFSYIKIYGSKYLMDGVVIAALITGTVSLIGIVVQMHRSRRTDDKRFDDLENELYKKHTLEKATTFHNETQKEILETRRDIKNRTDNTKEIIVTSLNHISNHLNSYQQNILLASGQNIDIKHALETIEGVIQENGILKMEKNDLIKKNIILQNQIEILKKENKELQQNINHIKERDMDDFSLSR